MSAWIVRSTTGINIQIKDITYCTTHAKWVAVGAKITDGTPILIESSDALSWAQRLTGFEGTAGVYRAVRGIDLAVDRGRIVVYCTSTIIEMRQNGTWTEVATGITAGTSSNKLIYLPGAGFCLMRASLAPDDVITVYISNDGVTWTGPTTVVSIASVGGGGNARALIRQGLHFIILYSHNASPNNSRVNYSSDGSAWNQATMAGYTNLIGMAFPPGKVILTARRTGDLVNKILSGGSLYNNWTLLGDTPSDAGFLEWNSQLEKLIVVNNNGNSSISSDGITWADAKHPAIIGYTAFTAEDTFVGSDDFLLLMKGVRGYIFDDFAVDNGLTVPTNPEGNPSSSPDEENITFTFNTNNPTSGAGSVNGYAIKRAKVTNGVVGTAELVRTIQNDAAPDSQSFVDIIPARSAGSAYGIYQYSIFGYNLDAKTVSASISVQVSVPDINITGSGNIVFGSSAILQMIGNPSGIYALIKDKTNDTLYERQMGATTTQNVPIPTPYFVTGYAPPDD